LHQPHLQFCFPNLFHCEQELKMFCDSVAYCSSWSVQLFLKFASYCVNTINIYQFYHQRNNCLLTYIALHVSTLMGHLQVLHVSHTQLMNCNALIHIYIWFKKVTFYVYPILSSRYWFKQELYMWLNSKKKIRLKLKLILKRHELWRFKINFSFNLILIFAV
jgi:hypothetical protein